MHRTHTVIIGGGQAGLAMSRCLTNLGVEHVVLERGRTAERWRSERWDSLRLLSPNWATRLPHWSYRGPDHDGFMTAAAVADHLTAYADSFDAPIEHDRTVHAVRATPDGFVVSESAATWQARNVVLATGWCDLPRVPAVARQLPASVQQWTPNRYRRPADLADGGVLIVGASATGVQLADELARAGRDVVLAVGRHSRMPRRYRGMDIWWWFEQLGTWSRTIDDVADQRGARAEGSVQLVGSPDRRDVDLPSLAERGVQLVGRLVELDGERAVFADDLATTTAAADRRMRRLLGEIDEHIESRHLEREVLEAVRPRRLPATPAASAIDLGRRGVRSVIWATGHRRSYPWLHVPVLDARGEIVHRRGITAVDGLYALGLRFQHRRDSNFIDGVGRDATFLADHIATRRTLSAIH